MVPDAKALIVVSATVSPTEDPEKVAIAVTKAIGGKPEQARREARGIVYYSEGPESLIYLRDQLRDRRVRAAARRLLTDARMGARTELMLNRQAAFAGVVALCGSADESPLGPIILEIESDALDKLIEWLTAYESG